MGRRKSNPVSGLAALIILCVASLALFTIYVKEGDSGPLHTVQLGASEVLRPVRGLLGFAASPFSAASERFGNVMDAEEKRELEEKALGYEEGAAEAARLRQENERLRQLLNGQSPSFTYSPLASVVAPVGGQLTKRVKINVGTNDGVQPEQPVVVGNNTLIGRTTNQVTPNTAEVLLITDQSFAAGVRIVPPSGSEDEDSSDDFHGEGLLRTSWEGYLGVDYVDLSAEAEQGDFVATSGRAGERELLFPSGLLVGTVESASQEVRVITDW